MTSTWLADVSELVPGALYEWKKRGPRTWAAWFADIDPGKNTHSQNSVDAPPNGTIVLYMGTYQSSINGYSFLVPNRGVLTLFNTDFVEGMREIR